MDGSRYTLALAPRIKENLVLSWSND